MNLKKQILVAPLNWGLGHATRCIPIIKELKKYKFTPIIASDGAALSLLEKEFPNLKSLELPSYNIVYPEKASSFKFKLLKDLPKLLMTIRKERKLIEDFIGKQELCGIISDNRFGVYSKQIPSVFITHQVNVLSGSTTWLSSKIHQSIIKKFKECWVPDYKGNPNLSGKLGHSKTKIKGLKFIGPISRFKSKQRSQNYKLLVLLSGPEPQRTKFEEKILLLLSDYKEQVLVIRGVVEDKVKINRKEHITIVNYMTSEALEQAINESELVLSRSGYSTIMDLAKLRKKAFFIPTPGQFEQAYLAKYLDTQGIIPFCSEREFNMNELKRINEYSGFTTLNYDINYSELFVLFECK